VNDLGHRSVKFSLWLIAPIIVHEAFCMSFKKTENEGFPTFFVKIYSFDFFNVDEHVYATHVNARKVSRSKSHESRLKKHTLHSAACLQLRRTQLLYLINLIEHISTDTRQMLASAVTHNTGFTKYSATRFRGTFRFFDLMNFQSSKSFENSWFTSLPRAT